MDHHQIKICVYVGIFFKEFLNHKIIKKNFKAICFRVNFSKIGQEITSVKRSFEKL